MPRPERPLDPTAGPVQSFAFELRKLRQDCGSPKYLQMARATGRSRTALAEAAGGDHLPTWETVDAYVQFCKGDPLVWRTKWERTQNALQAPHRPPASVTQPSIVTTEVAAEDADASSPSVQERSRSTHVLTGALTGALTGLAIVIIGALALWNSSARTSRGAVVVTVQNKIAVGPTSLTEDATPIFLSSRPVSNCRSRDCVVAGTDNLWSGALLPATCYVHAETITNANLSTQGIRTNPGAASSDLWYWIELPNDLNGYIAEAWIAPSSRGGMGLPPCKDTSR